MPHVYVCMEGVGGIPTNCVGYVSMLMAKELTVPSMVEERALWSSRNMQISYSLLQYICVALRPSPAVHKDVRLGRILMAVVDVREEVSAQLFSSYMPRYIYIYIYIYVLVFRKQHKNVMSLFLTQCSSATYCEMSDWTKTCRR
jgi:hypothetical protein